MPFTKLALAVAFGLAAIAPVHAGEPTAPSPQAQAPVYMLFTEGDLFLAPDGTVSDIKLQAGKGLTAEVSALVEKRVRAWRFEPILVDGKPVAAKTRLRLDLRAEPVAAGYRLRVNGMGFGTPVRDSSRMQPPEYPAEARQAGLEARVTLVVTLDAAGNVADAAIGSTSLSVRGSPRVLSRWAALFEKTALAAARKWKFQLTEEVGGHAVERTVMRVPVDYRLRSRDDNDDGWHMLLPVPGRGTVQGADGAMLAAAPSPPEGQPQALDSRFRLKDAVIGTLL